MTRQFVTLSPWARNALTPDELAAIHARAVTLEAHVSAVTSTPPGGWAVAVTDHAVRVIDYNARGSLSVALNAALDQFRAEKDRVAAELEAIGFPTRTVEDIREAFSADELVQIQQQSRAA